MLLTMQDSAASVREPSPAALTVGVGVAVLVGALAALLVVVALRRRRERLRRAASPTRLQDAWAESGRRMERIP